MNAQRGYAMILATASIALLALVLLAAARVHSDLRPSLRALQTRAEQELAAESLTARVAFLLLTEPIGPRSIVIGGPRELGAAVADAQHPNNELRLDGRFYAAEAGRVRAFVAVQDEAGLVNLNAPEEGAARGCGIRRLCGPWSAAATQPPALEPLASARSGRLAKWPQCWPARAALDSGQRQHTATIA